MSSKATIKLPGKHVRVARSYSVEILDETNSIKQKLHVIVYFSSCLGTNQKKSCIFQLVLPMVEDSKHYHNQIFFRLNYLLSAKSSSISLNSLGKLWLITEISHECFPDNIYKRLVYRDALRV